MLPKLQVQTQVLCPRTVLFSANQGTASSPGQRCSSAQGCWVSVSGWAMWQVRCVSPESFLASRAVRWEGTETGEQNKEKVLPFWREKEVVCRYMINTLQWSEQGPRPWIWLQITQVFSHSMDINPPKNNAEMLVCYGEVLGHCCHRDKSHMTYGTG